MFAWMKKKAPSFSSAKWGGRLRELLPLGIGLLIMGLALAAAGKRIATVEEDIRRRANPVDVVVASVSIEAGEEFAAGNLAKKSVPASGTGKRNILAADFELLLGSKAKSRVDPGEPVLWTDVEEPFEADVFSKTVPRGKRAITVNVDMTSSFSGLLQPGDRVDLLAKVSDGGTERWVRNVPVIAVDRHLNRLARPSDAQEAGTVTLMVTPLEGVAIASASTAGKLFWFLRNPDDNTALSAEHPGGRPSGAHRVEMWKGGIRVPNQQSLGETAS